MKVLLYTDGSMDVPSEKGGWAAWIQRERESSWDVRYGRCPAYVKQANHAELFAVYAGLKLAHSKRSDIRTIRVCSDSVTALRHVSKGILRMRSRDPVMLRIRTKIQDMLVGCHLQTAHVKSHQDPAIGIDHYINDRVDSFAERGRRGVIGPHHMTATEVFDL